MRQADSLRSRNAAGAIPHVDFRPRVSDAARYARRFVPRDGWCSESADSQRESVSVRAEVAFPAESARAAIGASEARWARLSTYPRESRRRVVVFYGFGVILTIVTVKLRPGATKNWWTVFAGT